ncbi:MAG: low specificity L-threonine aldolase [Rhizobiaceae bacterium]|nr:low specificity L-threonine aldolase [Rhizobiaceae bacterium]
MNFASDNWAGAHPAIAEALSAHAAGHARAYGDSELDQAVRAKLSAIFEREVSVFFVATGTAANGLSLASVARPGGVAFAHREAHLIEDEGGAPEFLTGGARICPVDGAMGRIDTEKLEAAIHRYPPEFIHAGQPMAVSITQATEIGTIYSLDEILALAGVCRSHGLPLHMDGARFANAMVALECTPAEMTWKAGVDLLSFGATKNGCWCAEAIVVLNPDIAADLPFLRKRAAQLFSKSRFIAAQFDAYLTDDLWLKTARHANRMAERLAAHIDSAPQLRLAWKPEANEVFAIMPEAMHEQLQAAGVSFYPWHPPKGFDGGMAEGKILTRFVTSFATTETEVDSFGEVIR